MFWNKKKYDMNMLKTIKHTSKTALKMQALFASNGDVEKAERLYDFLVKDMDDLPTFDIIPPSTMDTVKETAVNIFGWVKENQNDIMNGIELIKGLRRGGGSVPPAASPAQSPLPPL